MENIGFLIGLGIGLLFLISYKVSSLNDKAKEIIQLLKEIRDKK
jgi:hypothetical protein